MTFELTTLLAITLSVCLPSSQTVIPLAMRLTTTLYDALLVDQKATLDEIKVAFKKRALQVHPDKGGSKEAFHLVYEALETLANPDSRRKYDHSLVKSGTTEKSQTGCGLKRKRSHPKPKPAEPSQKHKSAKQGNRSGADHRESEAPAAQSKETKLLIKIRDLLKGLPRNVRSDVITKEFSQKQRLKLEKWMVDNSGTGARDAGTLPLNEQSFASCSASDPGPKVMQDVELEDDQGCHGLTIQIQRNKCWVAAKRSSAKQLGRHKVLQGKEKRAKRNRYGWGSLRKNSTKKDPSYLARIGLDNVELTTRYTDLQTALEYLVILTSVKQKVQDGTGLSNFEDRLQVALESSAEEHGRDVRDLKVVFSVQQRVAIFIGRSVLRSPCVRSFEALRKLRFLLNPFRAYAKKNLQGAQIYWQYSPGHLQDAWERFQKAVTETWEVAGTDCPKDMNEVHALYEATATSRQRNLESWERQHMAIQDKNAHRPRTLQDLKNQKWLRRERRHMALEDKNKHRPRGLKVRQKSTAETILSRKLLVLRKLLARWRHVLQRQEHAANKQRQKALRLRRLQRKKERDERKRSEVLKQKEVREEEGLRRESLRKRMSSSEFMDDLRWIWRWSKQALTECSNFDSWPHVGTKWEPQNRNSFSSHSHQI